jgi:hypothetical protein
VAALAATIAFAWQPGVTAVTSDEVGYVALARMFISGEPWGRHLATFPPLFPLLLGVTGSAHDLLRAHLLVAAFAVAALPLVHGLASRVLGRADMGFAVAVAFLLTPAAWLGAKQILSEPAFLVASLGALVYLDARPAGKARERCILGLLLAAAVSLRTAGFALVAAYAAHLALDCLHGRRMPAAADAIALVLPIAAAVAWIAMRPLEGPDMYALDASVFAHHWLADPIAMLGDAIAILVGGWIALFALASDGPPMIDALFIAFGVLCLAGAWIRLRANRVDGWYVAFYLAGLTLVFFDEQAARRFLYPVLPVLLVHAAVALRELTASFAPPERKAAIALAVVVPAVVSALSLAILVERARDDAPVLEGFPIRWSDMFDYYAARDDGDARHGAATNAGALAGFEAIARVTPATARVMWMRPEYVSVLANRPAHPWFYSDDGMRLALSIESRNVDFVALSGIAKSDLAGRRGSQAAIQQALTRFATPVVLIPNAVMGRPEFILLKVDRVALRAYLASN